MSQVTISIDMMGGDHGLKVTVPAVKVALDRHSDIKLLLVGDGEQLRTQLRKHRLLSHPRIEIVHASEIVEMGEAPSQALRNKKDSSMRIALNLIKEHKAQACVSAGNTGALMATARFVLKMLPGIDRPAIVYAIPTLDQETQKYSSVQMLDLGANVDCNENHLFQFAIMGSVLARTVNKIEKPRVALLNIGVEEIKGHQVIQSAAKLISESGMVNYTGFVEGNDIFRNRADVIVCDGFIGNVALKTIEGVVKFVAQTVRISVHKNIFHKLLGLLSLPILSDVRKVFDMRQYNGATFIGLNGVVIKSHGSALAVPFARAISQAVKEVKENVLDEIRESLSSLLKQSADQSGDQLVEIKAEIKAEKKSEGQE